MNKAILVGRASKDPESTTIPSGKTVCKFSIAVPRKFKADGQPDCDFFNITAWGKLGEIVQQYLKKGHKCGIVGTIQNRSWDGDDGVKRTVTDIIADEVEFMQPKENSQPGANVGATNTDMVPVTDDNIPF